MRALVTGAGGMLAQAVIPALRERGFDVAAATRAELDVTDATAVSSLLQRLRPDLVVQCAAYTAVDRAEEEEDRAHAINATATAYLARACQEVGSLIVYPSSDYVFDGRGTSPYRTDHPLSPLNAYGRTKAAGEEAARLARRHLVVRTSWLYGAGGGNFVDTMLRLARERDRLQVVDDQVGRPTWTATLASAIVDLAQRGETGIFHVSDGGEPVSWCGFARALLRVAGSGVAVEAIGTADYPRPAARPAYSVLDCTGTERVLGKRLPHWREAVKEYLASRPAG